MLTKPKACEGCSLYEKGYGFAKPDGGFAKQTMIVGEALAAEDASLGKHFQGLAGWQLNMIIARAGYERDDFFLENVVHCQPPNNRLSHQSFEFSAINHCRPYLDKSIEELQPKAIIALGNIPLRRLTGQLGIARYRGFVLDGPYKIPVIPTYHPSFLLPRRGQKSSAKWTGPVILDVQKAVRLAQNGFTRRKATYLLDPSPDLALEFYNEFMQTPDCYLSWDIETPYKLKKSEDELGEDDFTDSEVPIRISFCFRVGYAMSIPWTAPYLPVIRKLLGSNRPQVGWNVKAFDIPIVQKAGVEVIGDVHDGMNAFHVWLPNLPKGLEPVTSYCSDHIQPWKHLNIAEPALYNCIDSDAALENFLYIKKALQS